MSEDLKASDQKYQHMHEAATAELNGRPIDSEWTSGLCGCMDNTCNCCMGTWCPCVQYAQVAERMGHNGMCDGFPYLANMCLFFCAIGWLEWIPVCFMRSHMERKMGKKPNHCSNCLVGCCCTYCALCQMANQAKIQENGCSFDAPPRMNAMDRV